MNFDFLRFINTLDVINKETEAAFNNRRKIVVSVDESKRPNSAKNLMKVYKDVPENVMGTSGTFVKLNDDL